MRYQRCADSFAPLSMTVTLPGPAPMPWRFDETGFATETPSFKPLKLNACPKRPGTYDVERIFDKFYEVGNIQEHSSGKVAFKAKGAGLGLSIAKGVVDMHGGEIWVADRTPGATICFTLPMTEPPGEAPPGAR